MSQKTKERMLGLLLLLAIAAIFLPMLLDGEGVRQGQLQAVIPERPEIEEIVHYQPQYQPHQDSTDVAPLRPSDGAQLASPPVTKTAKTVKSPAPAVSKTVTKMGREKPRLDQQGVPAGWALQLASFKERDNAIALKQKLVKQGYKAYIRDKGDLSKVFVGPDLQRSVLEGVKEDLKRKYKLDGLILRYRP
ncbi:MAG: SPOR domain-containing protein [Motiliproteus sp.]